MSDAQRSRGPPRVRPLASTYDYGYLTITQLANGEHPDGTPAP